MTKVERFYTLDAWRKLSTNLKVQSGLKCERCGKIVTNGKHLIGHHKIELTEDNVEDMNISLNPENIEIICLDCHNKEHYRFGNSKQVFLVYGAPLSGKSTLVKSKARWGDIVVDIDTLWQAVTGLEAYTKPDNVRFNVMSLYNHLIDQIKTRYGNWYSAYIVGGFASKYERERLVQELGATEIYCQSTEAECLLRREETGRPVQWNEYIHEWFEEYERTNI